jgi:hypothetical protein
MRDGEKTMIERLLNFCRIAALLCVGLGFGLSATPAAAQCGGCYAAPVVSCGCCGCGSSYYGGYYAAYAYPSYGGGCCGGGYGGYGGGYGYGSYGDGYGYGGYGGGYVGVGVGIGGPVVAPRVWGPRPYYRRYVGPRRVYARY